jgi:hypothetical protein
MFVQKLGRPAPREGGGVSDVIACDKREAFAQGSEATKQSTLSLCREMDCFAEPVIGRRFAPTRWLAMTVRWTVVAL